MSVICVANLKGGVGKSSVAVNTAAALAGRGCETLLIDCDIQGSAKHLLGVSDAGVALADEFREFLTQDSSAPIWERVVQFCHKNCKEAGLSLSVLPLASLFGGISLTGTAVESRLKLLTAIITEIAGDYDYVVLDTAPQMDVFLQAALSVASMLLIPVDPSAFSVQAAVRLLQQIEVREDQVCVLLRTLVQTRASRVARESLKALADGESDLASLQKIVPFKKIGMKGVATWKENGHMLFLSGVVIPRSEQMHKLSFKQQTVFDTKDLLLLQERFKGLAREVEQVLEHCEQNSAVENEESLSAFILGSV